LALKAEWTRVGLAGSVAVRTRGRKSGRHCAVAFPAMGVKGAFIRTDPCVCSIWRQISAACARQVKSKGSAFGILADMSADLSLPRLAAMAALSERNAARKFTAMMGISPARFVETLRVDLACDAIQRGDVFLPYLPRLYGFGSASYRYEFIQKVGAVMEP
jgi:AraC-like DNA-binding protein